MLERFFALDEHLLKSQAIAEVFRIKVLRPNGCAGEESLPVLYAGDSDELFGGLATLAYSLQSSGATCPFMLVAIGYERSEVSEALRLRDFLPYSVRSLLGAIAEPAGLAAPTDARQFLQFIRKELAPLINASYRTLAERSGFFGYSAGATFGLYTLFNEPETFSRYVLGSPVTSHDGHHFAIEMARGFFSSGRRADAEVVISVGELEEFQPAGGKLEPVTGYYRLIKFLKETARADLRLTAHLFPGETHATAWSPAFVHGVRRIFGIPGGPQQ